MTAAYPPSARLHSGRDYSRIFNRQQKAAGKHVVVLACRRPPNAGAAARLGIVVSVKAVKLSVRRHQLKRWVRELFRTRLKEAAIEHDIVVLFRRDVPEDGHALLDNEIESLLPKALSAAPERRDPRRAS